MIISTILKTMGLTSQVGGTSDRQFSWIILFILVREKHTQINKPINHYIMIPSQHIKKM